MQVFNSTSKVIITCNKRLAPYLSQEVEELGFKIIRAFSTGIELNASVNDCIRLNLNLRCASQILYSIKSFQAQNADEVYREVASIAWEDLIDFNGYVSINSNVNNDTITTPLFANLKVKDAIADRIKARKGLRPDSGPELHRTVIHLYWQENLAEIFIDTSGETLAKHSYRKHPGKAPMLEALASGVVYALKWDKNSPFINPMCGSGTLAIEAALIATNRKPGLFRMNYGFMHILGYDEEVFFEARRALKSDIDKAKSIKIIASDISKEAIEIARKNAKTAGVDQLIDFQIGDFRTTTIDPSPGVVIFNPEYGDRLGVHSKLELTYRAMGDFLKQSCKGYMGYIFTGNPILAKKIGLRASRKTEFYNGKLDCRLLEYELYEGSKR
ncbi:THUMP domain-containing class I SAM-dependent RNA methyltransferase [Albibacterium profundi]|uniref:Class I SAM-dependent RNA methyltransferase n=1 Tax=Albibacterium profundi TaxID=3134906 RepID=A0ABV5CDA8_9SPHI